MEDVVEKFYTHSEIDTQNLGKEFASRLGKNAVIAFYGELGAGKTQFIKGICARYKVSEVVTSPTFTVINQYLGKCDGAEIKIYHIDLYRIKNLSELDGIGFEECLYEDNSIKLIEWAEKAEKALPEGIIKVIFHTSDDTEEDREVEIVYPEDYFDEN